MLSRLSGITVDVSPLRKFPAFRFFLAGQSIGWFGKHMRVVALGWQIYSITGSSVAVGMLGLTEVVPLIAFSSFAGTLADTHDRKRIMRWSQAAQVAVSLALAILTISGSPPLLAIYALSAMAAASDAFDGPVRVAIVPSLVDWDGIAPAFALRQILMQISQIIGPALGGILIGAFSVAAVYLVDAALFMVSIFTLGFVPSLVPAQTKHVSRLDAIKEGLRFALGQRLLRSLFLVDLAAMVFGMPRALFPELAVDVFGIGASGVGLLYAAPAAGAFLGAMLSGWVNGVSRQGIAIFVSVGVWGIAVTAAGLALPHLILTLILLSAAGAADVFSAVFRVTLLQQSTPDGLRGRVTSVSTMATVGGPPLGDVEAGTAAALIGLRGSIVFGGLACLAITAMIGWRYPELRRFRRGDDPGSGRTNPRKDG